MYLDDRTRALVVPSLFAAFGAFFAVFAAQAASAENGAAWLIGCAVAASLFTALWTVTSIVRLIEIWQAFREGRLEQLPFEDEEPDLDLPPPLPINVQGPLAAKSPDTTSYYEDAEALIKDAAETAIRASFSRGTLLESDMREALGGPDYEDTLASPDHRDGPGVLVSLGVVQDRAARIPGRWCADTMEEVLNLFRAGWSASAGLEQVEARICRRAQKLSERDQKRPGHFTVAAEEGK